MDGADALVLELRIVVVWIEVQRHDACRERAADVVDGGVADVGDAARVETTERGERTVEDPRDRAWPRR